MKYIRFICGDGVERQGILQADGGIQVVDGNLLGEHQPTGQQLSLDDVRQYLVPVDVPNIIALGLNYKEHIKEFGGFELPAEPVVFIKATSSLTSHNSQIVLPKEAPDEVDFEAELAVIIGKKARHITPDQAYDYIFGYTCANDVSARDCQQRRDKQWARGKSFDTFAPVGPVIETELDPTNLRIRSILNGQTMQDATTADMIFPVAETVSYLSRNMTLLPGTIIMTGTPPGVGSARKPQIFLKPGDTICVEIEGIATLENNVTAE